MKGCPMIAGDRVTPAVLAELRQLEAEEDRLAERMADLRWRRRALLGHVVRQGWDGNAPGGERALQDCDDFAFDHLSTLVTRAGSRRYVAEPYRIDTDQLRALVALADREIWEFQITAGESVHFPGHTVALIATPRGR
ncbi:MAG: hypothetical protein ACREMD_00835 [Gemmatimonadota bacterium]